MTQKQRTILFSVLGGIAALVAAQFAGNLVTRDRTALVPYSSEQGRFSAMLPANVSRESDRVDTKLGTLEHVMYKARSKFIQFLVAHTDYPQSYLESTNPAELLKSTAESAAANINGKLAKEESFLHNGLAVREVYVKGPKGVHMRCRVMLVGNRLYQVRAFSTGRHIKDSQVSKVFESFTIAEPPPQAAPAPAEPEITEVDTEAVVQ